MAKKVRIVQADNGLYIMRLESGDYGLTDKANATRFDTSKEVNKAITFCKTNVYVGKYTYEKLEG